MMTNATPLKLLPTNLLAALEVVLEATAHIVIDNVHHRKGASQRVFRAQINEFREVLSRIQDTNETK